MPSPSWPSPPHSPHSPPPPPSQSAPHGHALTSDAWDVAHLRHYHHGRRPPISQWGRVYGGLSLVFWASISGAALAAIGWAVGRQTAAAIPEPAWTRPNWELLLAVPHAQQAVVLLVAFVLGALAVVGLWLAASAPVGRLRLLAMGATAASAVGLVYLAAVPVGLLLLLLYLFVMGRALASRFVQRGAAALLLGYALLVGLALLLLPADGAAGTALAVAAAVWGVAWLVVLNVTRHAVPGL